MNLGTHGILIIGGLLMLLPFAWQLLASLSTNADVISIPPRIFPAALHPENYVTVFAKLDFGSQLFMSVAITVLRVGAQIVFCTMAGFAFARLQFRGKNMIFASMLVIMMVPPQAYMLSQYQIVQNLGWLNSILGIVAPGFFSAFGAFLMRQSFEGLPDELEEAARLDGASTWQIFWKIMLPLAVPGISALAVIGVLSSWNDLLWPLLIATEPGKQPLSVGLATMQGQYITDYPVLMAAAVLACLPVLIVFLFAQRRVIEGVAFSGLK